MAKNRLDTEQDKIIVTRYQAGESAIVIAKTLGVVKRTVYNALERASIRPRRKLNSATATQERDIIKRYIAGESPEVLAAEVGINRMTVYNILERNSIERRLDMTYLDSAQRKAAVEMCLSGQTVPVVAEHFNIGTTTMHNILREHEVSLKTGRPRTYDLNHTAFDVLTPECLYWLGFFFADGCVHHDEYGSTIVALGVAEKDRRHLENYQAFIGTDKPIFRRESTPLGGPFVCLHVRSTPIGEKLTSYGIIKKKTRIPIPNLAESPDFWRGAVDGDGSIGISSGRAFFKLFGQIPFLEKFQAFLTERGLPRYSITPAGDRTGNVWGVQAGSGSAEKIVGILYRHATIALERKWERAREIMFPRFRKNILTLVEEPSCVPVDITDLPQGE